MLHCTMNETSSLNLDLDDLLGELWYARRNGDLGRLAWLSYCDVRRWARRAGRLALSERSSELITNAPHLTRERFLEQVDELIHELEQVHGQMPRAPRILNADPAGGAVRHAAA
jgi:hypothetical protein